MIHLFTCFWMIFSEKCIGEYIDYYKNLLVNIHIEIEELLNSDSLLARSDYQFTTSDVKHAYNIFQDNIFDGYYTYLYQYTVLVTTVGYGDRAFVPDV